MSKETTRGHDATRPPLEAHARYEILCRLNPPELRPVGGFRARASHRLRELFHGDSRVDRFVAELARRRAVSTKELCESFEVFQRARKTLRGPVVADLCCGHGLVGLCFAVFEPDVERVLLLDQRLPQNHAACLEAAIAVAPWVLGRVEFRTGDLDDAEAWLPEDCGVLGIHACGARTDRVIELGLSRARSLAIAPCCYPPPERAGYPPALRHRLGSELAMDIHRTYRLTAAGWSVTFDAIPPEITPMNRVLIARRGPAGSGPVRDAAGAAE